ncbi:AAA family ATPase [Candidatus Omnitrophota bacterium]
MQEIAIELDKLVRNIEKVIVGKTESVKLLVVGLVTNGHILIEDVPGVGKTTLALALAKSVEGDFKRIQFTPDLLPSDVIGGSIYNQKNSEFEFKKGPVFTNILMADEINRTTPRTQSALLESMQEYKVTADGLSYPLPLPFMVVATQNPLEYQGTYPLPEAQIDRFLMKINLGYMVEDEEKKVLIQQKETHPINALSSVLNLERVKQLQEAARQVEISEKILDYIIRIISATRNMKEIRLGASPRASIALMQACRVWALMEGRGYVIPDDVIKLSLWTLRHRLALAPHAKAAGRTQEELINEIIKKTPVA